VCLCLRVVCLCVVSSVVSAASVQHRARPIYAASVAEKRVTSERFARLRGIPVV